MESLKLVNFFNNDLFKSFFHIKRRIHAQKKKETAEKHPFGWPRLLLLKKAAEYLGLAVWAMREQIGAGHIPIVQFPGGRKMYVDIRDIEEFIKKISKVIV